MRKVSLFTAIFLIIAFVFLGCPSGTDPVKTDPGTNDPGTTDPGTTDPGTTDPGTTDPGTTDPTIPEPNYVKYIVGGDEQVPLGNDNWGSGTGIAGNQADGYELTSGTGWGDVIVLAFTGIPEGFISRFDTIVLTVDQTAYTEAGTGPSIKIPEQELEVRNYATTSGTDTVYTVPLSIFDSYERDNEFGLIFWGSGTLNVKELKFTAANAPTINYTVLEEKIAEADDLIANSVVGTAVGEYPKKAVDALEAAIEEAQGFLDSLSQDDIDAATTTLKAAIQAFIDEKITPAPTELASVTIPEDATVLWDSEGTQLSYTNDYWNGGVVFDTYDLSGDTLLRFKVNYLNGNACGSFNFSPKPSCPANAKLYLSVYADNGFEVQAVKESEPKVKSKVVSDLSAWDWVQVEIDLWDAVESLYQLGIICNHADQILYIDKVYIVK